MAATGSRCCAVAAIDGLRVVRGRRSQAGPGTLNGILAPELCAARAVK